MPLIEPTLFGTRNKVQIAIERLRTFCPPEGYYLAFSGGKDSVTIKALADMAEIKYDAHYNVTTIDPPEVTRFIRDQHPDVVWERPKRSMFRLIIMKQWPPLRQWRYCCERLKERGGKGRKVLTGIRHQESGQRKNRQMVETCYSDPTKTFIHPIIDWSDRDVWEFIKTEDLPYCSLYDEGFHRVGCILCPYEGNAQNIQKQIERWPQFVKAYIRTFDRLIKYRDSLGKETTFKTGQELFDWWIDRGHRKKDPQEARLFE